MPISLDTLLYLESGRQGSEPDLIDRLKERAVSARAEGNMTARCDADHFDEAAALIASQAKRIAELEGGAVAEIAAERRRQVEVEGWMPEDDDEQHQNGEMAIAAGAYASFAGAGQHLRDYLQDQGKPPLSWPWAAAWWKPTTRRRDLVKAGALILAEIERLDRARAALKGET